MYEYIYHSYSLIWKISSLITFSVIIANSFFFKIPFVTITICIIHLLIIIPTGLIAKKMDNQMGKEIIEEAMKNLKK